ncbi:MAG: GCN5-related N-acetyltransferase [Frankiales bacterium]|nr:GCN5-related N-acetyltransferase [Frankiales bacterium]
MPEIKIQTVRYDHDDAQRLTADVQREYVRRYGGPDESPMDPAEFAEPAGTFLLAYDGAEPVGMGGWRRHGDERVDTAWAGPAAEIKRMYVAPQARGRGVARALLAELETTARAAGMDWLILETGDQQPEAIQLYESSGYREIPAFGHYANEPGAIHLGKPLSGSASGIGQRPAQ